MQLTFSPPRRVKPRCERGASGVEYALLISLVLVGSSASFDMMDESVGQHYAETADDIGQSDLGHFRVTTTTCGSCPTTTTSSTTTTTSTTTAPTTTSTTTTSTTTLPPTTTAATPAATTTYTDQSSGNNGNATAKVKLRLQGEDGKGLKGADVRVTMTTASGRTQTFDYTITTNNGQTTLTWSNRRGSDFPVTVTIVSVTLDGASHTPSPATFTLTL